MRAVNVAATLLGFVVAAMIILIATVAAGQCTGLNT